MAERKQVKKLSTELSVRAWAFYQERLDGLGLKSSAIRALPLSGAEESKK